MAVRKTDGDYQNTEESIFAKRRSCTDVIFLIIFIIFVATWIGLGIWGISKGDTDRLFQVTDSLGARCGYDTGVEDKPYLFIFNISKCSILGCDTWTRCVESCPETDSISNTNNVKITNFCKYNTNQDEINSSNCPEWYLRSTAYLNVCIPSIDNTSSRLLTNTLENSNLQKAINDVKYSVEVQKEMDEILKEIINAKWTIVGGTVITVLICIIYVFLLRWIAGIMVWISIFSILVGLSVGIYFSEKEYSDNKSTDKTKSDLFFALLILLSIILAIITIVLIFLRKGILLAIALIRESSRAVNSVTSILFFPLFPWIFQFGVAAFGIFVGLNLQTIQNSNNVTVEFLADNIDSNSIKDNIIYFHLYNIFGFLWISFFLSAFAEMVLAQTFAQWYWTRNKCKLPFFAVTAAIYRTLRYHIGTLAFGSLIVAICRAIRLCLEYIDQKLKKYGAFGLTKIIMCCLKCFFWCLEKFIKFINKNAYIMCAIHGTNFCVSAKNAFKLILNNIVRVFVLNKITTFLFFISKLILILIIGAISYLVIDKLNENGEDTSKYAIAPVVLLMIICYFVATLFFNVYDMAVDTLFLCFLEDLERNNGKDRPYFMSRNLMKIFGKKNKKE